MRCKVVKKKKSPLDRFASPIPFLILLIILSSFYSDGGGWRRQVQGHGAGQASVEEKEATPELGEENSRRTCLGIGVAARRLAAEGWTTIRASGPPIHPSLSLLPLFLSCFPAPVRPATGFIRSSLLSVAPPLYISSSQH
jgi:hypothetical protein